MSNRSKKNRYIVTSILVVLFCFIVGVLCVGNFFFRKNKENIVKEEEVVSEESASGNAWHDTHGIDWDSYFKEGGYFGDYGDSSISYKAAEVDNISIQAEGATIHVVSNGDKDSVEIFTKLGKAEDAIKVTLEDKTVKVLQASLSAANSSNGSYIEIAVPDGLVLNNLELNQGSGVTSIDIINKIKNIDLEMDRGTFYIEGLRGDAMFIDVNTGSAQINNAKLTFATLFSYNGYISVKDLRVKEELKANVIDGTVDIGVPKDVHTITYKVDCSEEGHFYVNRDEYQGKVRQIKDSNEHYYFRIESGDARISDNTDY